MRSVVGGATPRQGAVCVSSSPSSSRKPQPTSSIYSRSHRRAYQGCIYAGRSQPQFKPAESVTLYASVDIIFCEAINFGGGWHPQMHRSSLRAARPPSGAVIIWRRPSH